MKGSISFADFKAKRKPEPVEDTWVRPMPCHICGTMLKGAYGHTTLSEVVVWSCSKSCEQEVHKLKLKEYPHENLQG